MPLRDYAALTVDEYVTSLRDRIAPPSFEEDQSGRRVLPMT